MSRETWDKPRSHGTHLTEQEIGFIRDCYVNRYRAQYVAEKLKCSIRVIHKHYDAFEAQRIERKK